MIGKLTDSQRLCASQALAGAYRASGADMGHVAEVMKAAARGEAMACRAVVVDCLKLAVALGEDDPRAALLLALAAEMERFAAPGTRH